MKASFPIIGMHCASCARLIEKQLVKTPGVNLANVNYGSEQASVDFDETATNIDILAGRVKSLGYVAKITVENGKTPEEAKEIAKKKELKDLKEKLIISGALSLPVILGSFNLVPVLSNSLILLILATPVQIWAAKSFYQAAWPMFFQFLLP